MKNVFLLIILLALCSSIYGRQGRAPQEQKSLTLAAEITGQRYCEGAGGVDFLHLRIRLRFTNVGNQKLILYKGNNLFFSVWLKPEQDATARFEMKTTASRFLKMTPEAVDTKTPNRDFVFLSPQESFETIINVSLPIAREEARRSRGSITNGAHLLQISASTWYESRKLGEQLRERWQRKGFLWLDPLGSMPIRLNSEKPDSVMHCPATLNS